MYVIENNQINIEMDFELIMEQCETYIITKKCQFKITVKQGTSTPAIMGMLRSFSSEFHHVGHNFLNGCYDIFYKLTWPGITEDVKEKLSKMTIEDIEIFFNIDKDQMHDEALKIFDNSPLGMFLNSVFSNSNN